MINFRCKACGAMLDLIDKSSICTCDYCGLTQTLPRLDDEKKINLFTRANGLKLKNDFDAAEIIFENIISNYPEESEAYWGLLLCRYGIEYVEDPITGNRLPTCHRTCYESIFNDSDYNLAIQFANLESKAIYKSEAIKIDRIQKRILNIVGNEEPYDVFICYKESDDNFNRTLDSVLAQDIYNQLVENNLKVFFARVTLEDKLGIDYEPYIFSALNSAKVMLLVTTKIENVNAVWVKNEWSRFLKLEQQGAFKTIITCYKNIDIRQLPSILKLKQALDLNKIGAMQDLIRGILKIVGKEQNHRKDYSNIQVQDIVERGFIDLDNGNYDNAENLFRSATQTKPDCFEAYFGLILCLRNVEAYIKKIVLISPEISDFERKHINENNYYDLLKKLILNNPNGETSTRIDFIINKFWREIDAIKNENSILLYAISQKSCESIKVIVKNGYDINKEYPTYKDKKFVSNMTPLFFSLYFSDIKTMKCLLEQGCNPDSSQVYNDKSNNESYPIKISVLSDAVNHKQFEHVRLLVEHGADVNYKNVGHNKKGKEFYRTVLDYAIFGGSDEILSYLLKNGADPNIMTMAESDCKSHYILEYAICKTISSTQIKILADYGADVNAYIKNNKDVMTPLYLAICSKETQNVGIGIYMAIIRTLLNSGASWDSRVEVRTVKCAVRKFPFRAYVRDRERILFLYENGWLDNSWSKLYITHPNIYNFVWGMVLIFLFLIMAFGLASVFYELFG